MRDPKGTEDLAIASMKKFRHDANLYVFWRNVYKAARKAREEQEKVTAVWLNGREPPFMESRIVGDLNVPKIQKAVNCMTFEGLKLCAIGYLLCMQKMGRSPDQIRKDLEEAASAGTRMPVSVPEPDVSDGGKPAA